MSATRFAHGVFLGRCDLRREAGGFSFAELSPTVPEAQVQTHRHDDAHYVLLLDGVYLSSARGAPALCRGPALIYNPPGTTHRDCFRSEHGRFFTLTVSATRERELGAALSLPAQPLWQDDAAALLPALRLLAACRAWDEAAALSGEALSWELLAHTGRLALERSLRPAGWLRRVREQLRDECARPLRIADLARAAGVHPVHLAREFRRHYRCAPGDYLRRLRLERALSALADPRLPLAEVAAQAGYADAAHLGHAFRRGYGLTPGDYRRLRAALLPRAQVARRQSRAAAPG
ncbi:AraC family transcriptional regulator [Lysobacter firmicutimachus]|uniref:AraC family transcriptional regulator n=1 Tax=Lysobacter firmicutimachus TaxID=1792846 RepID=A0ABU8CZW0_9GAMM